MAWLPDPNEPEANFEEPIILNTLAIVERDFKEALDYYFAAEGYPDFAERALGEVVKNEFPCLAIGPDTTTTEGAEDNSHIIEEMRFRCFMGVVGDNAADVTTKIMRYMKVFNVVIRSAYRDLKEGLSNGFGFIVLRITHDYAPVGRDRDNASIYFRGALIEITLSLRER